MFVLACRFNSHAGEESFAGVLCCQLRPGIERALFRLLPYIGGDGDPGLDAQALDDGPALLGRVGRQGVIPEASSLLPEWSFAFSVVVSFMSRSRGGCWQAAGFLFHVCGLGPPAPTGKGERR